MIDFKQVLRFCTKPTVKISIEEFLFLWVVRAHHDLSPVDKKEIISYINLYFSQNVFYGRDQFVGEEKKIMTWNVMIEKLVRQEYLTDSRTEKLNIDLKKFRVTELFSKQIWFYEKEEACNRLYDLIQDNCGPNFQIGDSTPISYFYVNQRDNTINSIETLNNYFWKNICKEGSSWETEEFFVLLEFYLKKNNLAMKVSNLLINYHEGTLKREIIQMRDKEDNYSKYKRL